MIHRKKVLFFLHSSTGGAERVTITIGKMLPKDEFEVKYILIDKVKGNITSFIPPEYEVEYYHCYNIWLGATAKILGCLRKEHPYAVFCSSMSLSVRVLLAAHFVGNIKIIIRNCNYFSTIRWDERFLCRLTYRYADKIIAQQSEMKDDILHTINLHPSKVIVLQNPLDKESINRKCDVPSPYIYEDTTKYVWVGRFDKTKGQDILAKAFVKVARSNFKAHLYFVGTYNIKDDFFQQVQKIIIDGCVQDRVHFIGFDPNPYRWIKYCDCFVLPSRVEGLPNSLIEAQYIGKPVVATTCIPIIGRIIKDEVTGYTVPSEDYNAMAEAMLKAPFLGKIQMIYGSASDEEFIELFK